MISPTALMAALLVGCAATEERARAAFREHNRVTSDLMLALPAIEAQDPRAAERLWAAEAAMAAACAPLDRLAVKHRQGEDLSAADRAAVPPALDDCERATAAAAELLAPWMP